MLLDSFIISAPLYQSMKSYLKSNGTPYHIFIKNKKKRLACIAYQAYFNLAPSNLTELFTKHATKYNLRDNLKFDLTHKFWKGQNDSFIHRASIIWNSLPTKIKTAPSLAAFKASLVKNSKCIDSISFGCSATGTFKNSEDFIYF